MGGIPADWLVNNMQERRLPRVSRRVEALIQEVLPPSELPAREEPKRVERGPRESSDSRETEGLYIISVASRMLAMHPQTLRKYERVGLVRPSRTVGMLRLYSDEDIAQLRIIKNLVDRIGLNLAGVELVMQMLRRLQALRQERVNRELRDLLEALGID